MAQINNVWRPAQRLYSARRSRVLLARPGRRLFMARTLRSHDRGRHEHAVIIRGTVCGARNPSSLPRVRGPEEKTRRSAPLFDFGGDLHTQHATPRRRAFSPRVLRAWVSSHPSRTRSCDPT